MSTEFEKKNIECYIHLQACKVSVTELTEGVTVQQGIITPPKHLITPLVFQSTLLTMLLYLYDL